MNTHPPQPHRILLLPLAAALLAACASDPLLPPPMVFTPRSDAAGVITGETALTREPAPPPTVPGGRSRSTVGEGGGRIQVRNEGGLSEYATFDQVPLAALVQTVLADILGRNVTVDPEVMQRRDVVTFRMPPGQTRRQVADAVQQLLKSYGVALIDEGELVRVAADSSRAGYLPEIARGAALPETPQSLRPLFQLVELGAVRNNEVAGWISTLFEGRVAVKEDAARNAVVLSGSPEHVAAAVEAIKILDRPLMAGRASARFAPTYWSAEELAKRLTEILAAEGYSMPPVNWSPTQPGARYPIILLPVSALNVVLVFAVDPGVIPHIERWVAQLDQYSEDTPDKSIFSYAARYTTAANLARTLNQFLGSGSAATAAPQPAGGSAPAAGESRRSSADKVVVDEATNTLILQASPESYSQILRLLRSLDKPSKAALVEMTVAEVTLTENSQLGVEWLFRELTASGAIATGGTFGGLGVGTDGFTFTRLSGDGNARVLLNALASNNRARILSSPRIMARNGEEAMIQVGQEVPIISSQQSTVGAVDPDGVGVLQTIQYRDTGVILKVKPTIHSGDRVDLDVSQEVSAAQATTTGVDTSPTFATRKLETKLTLQNGSTVLLGGLISSDQSAGDTGVPFLKDIPLLGRLFRRDTNRESKTELIVLITPYIVNDDIDARAVTQAFKSLLGSFADERLPGESAERADPPLPTGAAEPAPPPAPAGPAAPPAVPEAAAPAPG